MPIGLRKVPSLFQQMMDATLLEASWQVALIYLEYIFQFSRFKI